MTKRILTWTFDRHPSGGVMLPAFYMETDYEPVAVRVYAESLPKVTDAKFDILVDGVSIFSDMSEVKNSVDVNYQHQHVPTTSIELPASASEDTMAENFKDGLTLNAGSWVTCKVTNDGGARNVSIHLELITVSESDEDDE
mgnify:CR=1 FL=1